jgi:hypothetical protein
MRDRLWRFCWRIRFSRASSPDPAPQAAGPDFFVTIPQENRYPSEFFGFPEMGPADPSGNQLQSQGGIVEVVGFFHAARTGGMARVLQKLAGFFRVCENGGMVDFDDVEASIEAAEKRFPGIRARIAAEAEKLSQSNGAWADEPMSAEEVAEIWAIAEACRTGRMEVHDWDEVKAELDLHESVPADMDSESREWLDAPRCGRELL